MPDDSLKCSDRLKVLADETRLGVLQLLFVGPKPVAELQQYMGVEQSLFSHHLKVLRDAGLVISQREGKGVLYSLAPGVAVKKSAGVDLGCCQLSFE